MRLLVAAIQKFLVTDDEFGLIVKQPMTFAAVSNIQTYAFATSSQKLTGFNRWLNSQIQAGIFEVDSRTGDPWTAQYIKSAYKKGIERAYLDVNKKHAFAKDDIFDFYTGSREQFLRSAFFGPESVDKLKIIYARDYESLRGVGQAVSQRLSSVFATGLANGENPNVIARTMTDEILGIDIKRARVIARTEIIHAHAEGQLDSFEKLGVEELGLQAEWSTAGDNRVCQECDSHEGETFQVAEAHGLIPLHPNCFIDGQVPIFTSKGWRPIKEIKVGDLVLTHKKRFRKVTQLFRTPKQLVLVVKVYIKGRKCHDRYITVTDNHSILLNNRWIEAKDAIVGMAISYLACKCKRCEKLIPFDRVYCSQRCISLDITDKQWVSEEHRKNISEKARQQMYNEYDSGERDCDNILENAHEAMRELVKQGKCPLTRPDVREKIKLVTNTPEMRESSSQRMKLHNPVFDPEIAKHISLITQATFMLHPERHPNVIMAKKGFMSSLEKKMKAILEEMKQEFVQQFPIDRYFADFVLPKYKLVIEVDGAYWHKNKDRDQKRQKDIEKKGWIVVRFNDDEMKEPQLVKDELSRVLMNHNKQYDFIDMQIYKIEKYHLKKSRTLYNFSVEEDESYIAKGFVVHNCRCCWVPIVE